MSPAPSQYEFTGDQNQLIGSLAGKMRFVGLFAVILGVINLLLALLVVAAVYRDRLPADWMTKTKDYLGKARDKLPGDVKKQAEEYSLDKLPPNNHLWGIALDLGVVGLFFLLMGVWTRSAAASFRRIVDTRGNDIANLMNGLGALHSMYSFLYLLLVAILLLGLVSLGLTIYQHFVAR
jgi:hypothetical protein